uniref:Putative secreted protein n=1 Tax=Lutzomyia longipalpis TaxID=7200 RepID=A0A7G3AQ24_LUTLO
MWQSSGKLLVLFLLCCLIQNFGVLCADENEAAPTETSSQPLDDDPSLGNGPEPEVIDVKDLPPFPVLRNRLLDTANEVETFNGYHYDKPEIPFDDTNINQVQVDGYSYPKPQNPLTYPDQTNTVQEEEPRNLTPQNPPESASQGPPVIDLPEDSIRILDDDVTDVDDEPNDAADETDASNAN